MEHWNPDTRGNENQVDQSANFYTRYSFPPLPLEYQSEKIKPRGKLYRLFSRLIILLASFCIGSFLLKISMYQHSTFEGQLGELLLLGWFVAINLFENLMISIRPLRTTIYRLETRLQITVFSAFTFTMLVYFLYSNGIHGLQAMGIDTMAAFILVGGNFLLNISLNYFKPAESGLQPARYNPYAAQQSNYRPQD